ncbi:tau 95 subunit of transcription factor TFIIIC [Orbilia brochopaga]|uniref:Tau 95 subunit of transcription factor TFIIIC n=1 Tax=Orbilia brochopaga TaxID=3140254 RepID=A0AAV9V5A4_9PEZI
MSMESQNGGDGLVEEETNRPRPTPPEAPWYEIPDRKLLSVEHPAVVKNTDKAIRMLGGPKAVAKAFKPNPDKLSEPNGLELRFRPGDALAPPVQGKPARTRAVLLRITVPKGKGLAAGATANRDEDIPKTLRQLNGKYKAEVMGFVDHTVRFRAMADYQWNTRNSAWAKNVEENLMELDLQALKRFRMSETISADATTEIMRPPTFTHTTYPHVYGFRQNPALKLDTNADGEAILVTSAGHKVLTQTQYGKWDIATVPQSSGMSAPRGPRALLECIHALEELFLQRPIWTRRGLMNSIPSVMWKNLKFAYPYVAYYWRSGPWRDTYVRFGVDPRTDKEFAKYQVAAFKLHMVKRRDADSHARSHIFDGERIVLDGKIWQFCDLTEPLLAELVDIRKVEARETCDPIDGWYPNNRHYKIKHVMRRKLSDIIAGRKTDNKVFEALLKEPDSILPGAQPVKQQTNEGKEADGQAGSTPSGTNLSTDAAGDLDDVAVDEGNSEADEEFDSENDSDEDEGGSDRNLGKSAAPSARDERLQTLMERFMVGQQPEGIASGSSRGAGFGVDADFDILSDD